MIESRPEGDKAQNPTKQKSPQTPKPRNSRKLQSPEILETSKSGNSRNFNKAKGAVDDEVHQPAQK